MIKTRDTSNSKSRWNFWQFTWWLEGSKDNNQPKLTAANPQPPFRLNPLRGISDVGWSDLASLLGSLINVGIIAAGIQPEFLQLHLLDQAVKFFRAWAQVIKDNLDLCFTTLWSHFFTRGLRDLHKLQFLKPEVWS